MPIISSFVPLLEIMELCLLFAEDSLLEMKVEVRLENNKTDSHLFKASTSDVVAADTP